MNPSRRERKWFSSAGTDAGSFWPICTRVSLQRERRKPLDVRVERLVGDGRVERLRPEGLRVYSAALLAR